MYVAFSAIYTLKLMWHVLQAERKDDDSVAYRKFRRQLFHSSVSAILQSLKPGMSDAEVLRCADGHFRRAIFDLAAYIADYPEQVLLTSIVSGWCPRFV